MAWEPSGSRQRNHMNQIQFDRVVRGLTRLETSMDELKRQIDSLPEALKKTLNGEAAVSNTGGVSPMRRSAESRTVSQSQDDEECSSHRQGREDTEPMLVTQHIPTMLPSRNTDVHRIFEQIVAEMERASYSEVLEVRASVHSVGALSALESATGWASSFRTTACLIHPASRFCVFLDAVRILFLLIDAIFVPYTLAYKDSLEDWFLVLSLLVFGFWFLDMVMNFLTGYIQPGGGVVMRWPRIICRYMQGYFLLDFVAVAADGLDLAAALFPDEFSAGFAWESLSVLRLLKLSRLIRTVAKLNAGLAARVRSNFSQWIEQNGWTDYEHHVHFAMILVRLLLVIAWFGHVGSCIWYYAGQRMEASSSHFSYYDTAPGDDRYMQGLYWAITTMFSGTSPAPPQSTTEIMLAVLWVAMGAMFVTSFTSTLAATLIESSERQKDITRKNRLLATFLGQRRTPGLLAVAVHSDFLEKARSAPVLTELDLPFLEMLDPMLRANLRECYHGKHFAEHNFFRMLTLLDKEIVTALCFRASVYVVLKDGEEMFAAQQELQHTLLLTRGFMWYTPALVKGQQHRTTLKAPTFSHSAAIVQNVRSLLSSSTQSTKVAAAPRISTQPSNTGSTGTLRRPDASPLSDGSWIAELALLVSWMSSGILEAEGICELLLISSEAFIRLATTQPVLEAVVSSYAVQVSRMLLMDDVTPTDIDSGLDVDMVIFGLHPKVRSTLISTPILLSVQHMRRQIARLPHRKRRGLSELQDEVRKGKCHLCITPDGDCCRVIWVVAIELMNQDGQLCIMMAERASDGTCMPKFRLPGRKMQSLERPDEVAAKLVRHDLAPLASAIRLGSDARTVIEHHPNSSYGLKTKCIKTIYSASLEGRIMLGEGSPTPSEQSGQISERLGPTDSGIPMRSSRLSTMVGRQIRSSVFPTGAFPTSGLDHAFAMVKCEDDAVKHPRLTNVSIEDTSANIYRWMDPIEYAALNSTRRADAEKEIRARTLTASHLKRLADWSVRLEEWTSAESFTLVGPARSTIREKATWNMIL